MKKPFKVFLIIFLFVISPITWMIYALIVARPNEIIPSSNDKIIREYRKIGGGLSDSIFLNQVAEAFLATNYEGSLSYSLNNAGGHHKLWDIKLHIEMTDRFPKIREIIENKYPNANDSWYGYKYKNGVVIINYHHLCTAYNSKKKAVFHIYAPDRNKLKQMFPTYKMYYDKTIPSETCEWLYYIGNNWYVCSPSEDLLSIMTNS